MTFASPSAMLAEPQATPQTTPVPEEPRSVPAATQRSIQLEELIRQNAHAFRVLTGDRPTGPLHLGHYFGSLRNRMIAKVVMPRKTAVAKKSCMKPSASHRPMIGMWKFSWKRKPYASM